MERMPASRDRSVERKGGPVTAKPGAEAAAPQTQGGLAALAGPAIQLRAAVRLAPPAAPDQPETGAGRPLEPAVQARMEQSFAADFSDVTVRESRQATSLGALAYTRGSEISFAPGQYRPASQDGQQLIGHELAHVVQQREGRVVPSGHAGGLPVNDEPGLEQEADRLGAQAAHGLPASEHQSPSVQRTAAPGVIQFAKETPNKGNWVGNQLDAFLDSLVDLVTEKADEILDDPNLVGDSGYITRWNNVYANYVQSGGTDTNFLHAAYGYAVETLVTNDRAKLNGHLPGGWSISPQATRGGTRPDLVVKDGTDTDRGWFDLTSTGSPNHIYNKAGTGWVTKDYVAEVFYTALDTSQLGRKGRTPASTATLRHRATDYRRDMKRRAEYINQSLPLPRRNQAAQKRRQLEESLGDLLNDGDKVEPNTAKSILVFISEWADGVSVNDLFSTYGYTGTHKNGRNREAAENLVMGIELPSIYT